MTALLEYEREKYYRRGDPIVCDGQELRVGWADRADHSAGFFLWPRDLLDRLEAGQPAVLQDWQLGSRRVQVPKSLRPGSTAGKWFRVSADDVVERVGSPVVDRLCSRPAGAVELDEEDDDDGDLKDECPAGQ